MKFKHQLLTGAILGACLSGQASALSFDYIAYGGFEDGSAGAGFPAPVVYDDQNEYHDNKYPLDVDVFGYAGWSGSDPQSHLDINQNGPTPANPPFNNHDDTVEGTVTVSDAAGALFGTLTHNNNPIAATEFQDTIQVHYHLDLFEQGTNNLVWESPVLTFDLEVWETPNGADPCADGGANGVPPNQNGCADLLRFGFGGAIANPLEDILLAKFYHGDQKYGVYASGFYDENDVLVGEFWSAEGLSNSAYVNFEVHEVPVPGTLLLGGIGLLGLAWRRRTLG